MDTDHFLLSLEEIQRQILPVVDKEQQIAAVVAAAKGDSELSDFLVQVIKGPHGRRLIQIIEQYPAVYSGFIDESSAHHFLSEATSLRDHLLILNIISMTSIALTLHNNQHHSNFSIITSSYLISFGLEWMKSEDLSVAERSSGLLMAIVTAFDGASDQMTTLMTSLYGCADAVRSESTVLLRYLSIAVDLVKKSETAAIAFLNSKLFALLNELCRSDDLLAAINGIEYLAELTKGAGAKPILDALSREVVATKSDHRLSPPISWLTSLCQEKNNPTFDPFLRDTSMRALVSLLQNAVSSGYGFVNMNFTVLIDVATEILEDRAADIESRLAGLAVISDLAQTSSFWFQRVLFPSHDPSYRTLSAWMSLLHTGKSELVAAGLFALAHVLLHPDEKYATAAIGNVPTTDSPSIPNAEEVAGLKRRLVNAVGIARNTQSIKFLLKTARQPVSPLRVAAMDVMHAMIKQVWGLTMLTGIGAESTASSTSSITQSEFLQYLVDRTTEMDKEGKDAKFEIILAVKDSPHFGTLSADAQVAIDRMIAQGAYYMPALLGEMQTI